MSKIASLAVVLSFRIFGLLTHDLCHSQRRLRKASRLSGLPLPPNALYISRNGTTGAGVVAAEAEVVVAVAAVVVEEADEGAGVEVTGETEIPGIPRPLPRPVNNRLARSGSVPLSLMVAQTWACAVRLCLSFKAQRKLKPTEMHHNLTRVVVLRCDKKMY